MANPNPDKQALTLKVRHQRLKPGEEPPSFDFPKTMTVGAAAAQAATQLGYTGPPDTFTFEFNGTVLERNRPLVSYHLKDGDTVTLTSLGTGA